METKIPIKIIHCDDHKIFRDGVKRSLQKYPDVEVIGEAENGQVLLDLLETLHPDIILLDLQMPVLDGLETLQVLKIKFPIIKIIILCVHNDASIICKLMEMGANSYLTTESGSEKIYEVIKGLSKKWFYMTDTMQKAITTNYYFPKDERDIFSNETLTEKQKKILDLLSKNISEEKIAAQLDLTPRTIYAIIDKLKKMAEADTRDMLLDAARKEKIISS